MKKTGWILLFVLTLSALVLSACSGGGGSGTSRPSLPADFANLTNPFEGQADAVSAGQALYATNCASCHGDMGKGDGPAAAALDPAPANLQVTAAETEPAYTYWLIHEGGAAAGLSSSMVAYEGILTEDQMWQIVTCLEATYGK